MSGKIKLYNRIMLGNIPKDVTFNEIKRFLESMGFIEINHAKSSHHIFKHSKSHLHVNIPAHGDGDLIKRAYISNVRKIIMMIENKGE